MALGGVVCFNWTKAGADIRQSERARGGVERADSPVAKAEDATEAGADRILLTV